MPTLTRWIQSGFFPRELPPAFSSNSAALALSSPAIPASPPAAKAVSYTTTRVGGRFRELALPNPFHFSLLAARLAADWGTVAAHLALGGLSKSVPHDDPSLERALAPASSLASWPRCCAEQRATARFVLKADVAAFYSSVYTHSIPWALHTKAWAKGNINTSCLGNDLDKLVRNGQDRQTKGIPTGPDTSLVIAEIILAAVDATLRTKVRLRGLRFVDDYELYFQSKAEADEALSILEAELREFELQPSAPKTLIQELPDVLERPWVLEIDAFNLDVPGAQEERAILRFFDHVFALAKTHPTDHVVKYALRKAYDATFERENRPLVLALALQCAMTQPGVLPIVVNYALRLKKDDGHFPAADIGSVLNAHVTRYAPLRCSDEVAWALWGAAALGLRIDAAAAKIVSGLGDPVVAILAIDGLRAGWMDPALDPSAWLAHATQADLWGPWWLWAFEANVHGWLGGNDYVAADRWFSVLKNAGVRFYAPVDAVSIRAAISPPTASSGLY